MNLTALPADVIGEILRFAAFDGKLLGRLARVSKRLNAIASDERLWKEALFKRWSYPDLTSSTVRRMTWRKRYHYFAQRQREGLSNDAREDRPRRERKWRVTADNVESHQLSYEDHRNADYYRVCGPGIPYFGFDTYDLPWDLGTAPIYKHYSDRSGKSYSSIIIVKIERHEYQVIDLDEDENQLTLLDADGSTRQLPQAESLPLAADIVDGLANSKTVTVVVEKILEEEEIVEVTLTDDQ